jgi:hypothetical protein
LFTDSIQQTADQVSFVKVRQQYMTVNRVKIFSN